MAVRYLVAGLCIAVLAGRAAADDPDRLAGLVCLDRAALAGATGGFRVGNLEIGIGAVIRTAIADGTAAGADGRFERIDAYALEAGMPADVFRRIEVPGTAISGRGLATIIENTQSDRAISRQVTLDVEIAGLVPAIRAAAAARAIAPAAHARPFR